MAGRQGKGHPCRAPPRIKLLEKPAWVLCRGTWSPLLLVAPAQWEHPQAVRECGRRSFWPSPSLLWGGSLPHRAVGLHAGLAVPSSWCPVPIATMLRAWGVLGSPPSSSIGRSQPGLIPLTPVWGCDLAWGGSRGHGSPPRSASSLSCLFVHLSCPVPPHWSLVSTEVGGGPGLPRLAPQPCAPFSSWLCLSCALQGPLVWPAHPHPVLGRDRWVVGRGGRGTFPGLSPTPPVVGSLNCSYGVVPTLNFYIPRVLGFCRIYVHIGGGVLGGVLGAGRMGCCGQTGG